MKCQLFRKINKITEDGKFFGRSFHVAEVKGDAFFTMKHCISILGVFFIFYTTK